MSCYHPIISAHIRIVAVLRFDLSLLSLLLEGYGVPLLRIVLRGKRSFKMMYATNVFRGGKQLAYGT